MTAPANVPPTAAPAESTWEGLLAAALVGTARRPPPASLGLDFPFGSVASDDAAALLLTEAAVLSAYRRAGRLPGEAPRNLPAPAAPDDRPPCSTTAVEVLELILSGQVPIPGGTELRGIKKAGGGVILVDFTQPFAEAPDRQAAVRTLVASLTSLPGVNGVQILVEGTSLADQWGQNYGRVFRRMAINAE